MAHVHLNVSYKTLTIQNRCHTSLRDYFFLAQFLARSEPRALVQAGVNSARYQLLMVLGLQEKRIFLDMS
jgi:hypothetical protein